MPPPLRPQRRPQAARPQAPAPKLPIAYATINLNASPEQVKVKDEFPAASPLFVLLALTKTTAKIGVAGGSFDNGKAVTLEFGKKVTLVNTATGVRYVLKLVYTGTAPEVIEGFTTTAKTPAGSTTGTTTPTTTTSAGATTTTAK